MFGEENNEIPPGVFFSFDVPFSNKSSTSKVCAFFSFSQMAASSCEAEHERMQADDSVLAFKKGDVVHPDKFVRRPETSYEQAPVWIDIDKDGYVVAHSDEHYASWKVAHDMGVPFSCPLGNVDNIFVPRSHYEKYLARENERRGEEIQALAQLPQALRDLLMVKLPKKLAEEHMKKQGAPKKAPARTETPQNVIDLRPQLAEAEKKKQSEPEQEPPKPRRK